MIAGKGATTPTTPHQQNSNTTATNGADGCDLSCGNGQGRNGYQQQIGFAGLRERLGHTRSEFTSVCHQPADGGAFSCSVLEWGKVSGHVEGLPDGCIWFSVNPTRGPQRSQSVREAERDVTRWAALCLDIKDVAFDDVEQIRRFIHSLSGKVGQFPSALIFSGYGVQQVWAIEDGQLDTAQKFEQMDRIINAIHDTVPEELWPEILRKIEGPVAADTSMNEFERVRRSRTFVRQGICGSRRGLLDGDRARRLTRERLPHPHNRGSGIRDTGIHACDGEGRG